MPGIWIHEIFAPIKRSLPAGFSSLMRGVGTSLVTPVYFSFRSGHFLSSIRNKASDRTGEPIPWYSYPAVDFLKHRDYGGRTVLEFGGGQSTLFWAKRCRKVLSFEGDPVWHKELKAKIPSHVDLKLVSVKNPSVCLKEVREKLREDGCGKFDLIIIDGLYRRELAELSVDWVGPGGAIIADNSEGYGFFEVFKDSDFQRVDFFGHAPGVLLPHTTSIYFKGECFLFKASIQIPGADYL